VETRTVICPGDMIVEDHIACIALNAYVCVGAYEDRVVLFSSMQDKVVTVTQQMFATHSKSHWRVVKWFSIGSLLPKIDHE